MRVKHGSVKIAVGKTLQTRFFVENVEIENCEIYII